METEIIVPAGMTYPEFFEEEGSGQTKASFLSEKEFSASTSKLVVVCTDVVLVDSQDQFVLAYRRHACAQGWWWKGGINNMDRRPGKNIAALMQREISMVPSKVVFLAHYWHWWADTRERPGEGRCDSIYLHVHRVGEETIAGLKLAPDEYDAAAGYMRYNGTQEVRPVMKAAYMRYLKLKKQQPELFA